MTYQYDSFMTQFKKAIFRSFVFWIILAVIFVRLFATFQLGETFYGSEKTFASGRECELKEDITFDTSPGYVYPHPSQIETYGKSTVGKNLVNNSGLKTLDGEVTVKNYDFVPNTATSSRKLMTQKDGKRFLRADQKISGNENKTFWVPEFFTIENKAYFYSFQYRSTVNADVTVEFQKKDGSLESFGLHLLEPKEDWSYIQGHFNNYSGDYLKAHVIVATTGAGIVDVKESKVYQLKDNKLKEPMISVTFDDGWESIYANAIPLLDKYDIPTTQFIIAGAASQKEPGYMNFNQIKALAKSGHEIASHSLGHCDQTTLSDEDLDHDSKKSKTILSDAGFEWSLGFAYPYGKYNQKTQTDKINNYVYIRSSDAGFNDYYFDQANIKVMTVQSKTTLKEVNDWIKHTKENNLWLVLLYHRIDEHGDYSTTAKDLESHLKAIKDSGVKTYTISQALDNMVKY